MEELKSGKGKEKQLEEKEEPIPPISVANVAKMEAAPHLPRWMSGQCKLLRELLGGLGEEWVAEDMEGGRGRGVGTLFWRIRRIGGHLGTNLPGGSGWAWFETKGKPKGTQREYGAKWGGSKKGGGGGGQQAESQGGGEGGGGRGCCSYATGILSGGGGGVAPRGAVL